MKIAADVRWEDRADAMELGKFFASHEVSEAIINLSFQVIDAAEELMNNIEEPHWETVTTAVTVTRSGEKIHWDTDPRAIAKKLVIKDPKEFPIELPGLGSSVHLVGLVFADHPNSENYQYGMNGFPATRFFTGAFNKVAADTDSRWFSG